MTTEMDTLRLCARKFVWTILSFVLCLLILWGLLTDGPRWFIWLVEALSKLAWPGAVIAFAFLFREPIALALSHSARKLAEAGPIRKFGPVEFDAPTVTPDGHIQSDGSRGLSAKEDVSSIRDFRHQIYLDQRNIFIVHEARLMNDKEVSAFGLETQSGQMHWEVKVELDRHISPQRKEFKGMEDIESVEYYFGDAWGKQSFVSKDRHGLFAMKTFVYAPFLCVAEITFSDQTKIKTFRYVDLPGYKLGRISGNGGAGG
ncbi:pYEATS domain-containing protein [Elioraea sp.]|uniref:pYEATS domain-containing protein n=1 Tax=Elioraea sp. TaxID=2185103 RepID=UPI003F7048E9